MSNPSSLSVLELVVQWSEIRLNNFGASIVGIVVSISGDEKNTISSFGTPS